jgi:hypothetical protein
MDMTKVRFLFVVGLILAAAVARVLPHPPNFAPVAAMALFAGASFRDKRLAFAIPAIAMVLSDLVIDLHLVDLGWEMPLRYSPVHGTLRWEKLFVYGAVALSVGLGFWLQRRRTVGRITAATLASSVVFFVVTNFGSWVIDTASYARSFAGLMECYLAGLPFWRDGTLPGDVFYSFVLFGGLALAEKLVPGVQEAMTLETT